MQRFISYPDAQRALQDVQENLVSVYVYRGNPQQIEQADPVTIRSTILKQKWGLENFIILKAEQQKDEDQDPLLWKAGLEFVLGRGIEHNGRRFKIVGASSSLKDGKFWLAEESLISEVHQYFGSAQEALTYFGIFTSSCHHGIWELSEPIELVEDGNHNTGDGFGYIPEYLLKRLELPVRQIQVRFVGKTWLGKGTLHPYDGERFILPKSMIKGAGLPDGEPFWFGVRDTAETRRYSSNFTVAQWFDESVHEALRPVVNRKLEVISQAFESPEKALAFLGLFSNFDEETGDPVEQDFRMLIEEYLGAGLSPKHRYIHNKLKELTRKAYVELASGGGIELTGRMMAYADLPDGVVCIPDEKPGPVVVSRYPIRDKASFLLMENHPNAINYSHKGSIYMNEKAARQIDGDFDGDYAIVNTQQPIIEAVSSPEWLKDYQREDVPPKRRKSDPLHLLPFIAVESIGNSIGYITYLISGAVSEGKVEYIPALSAQLQAEVQKLKWDTRADWNLIEKVKDDVDIPEYISQFKTDRELFIKKAERLEANDVVANNTNYVVKHWKQLDTLPEPLVNFRHLIPLWANEKAPEFLPEAKAVVGFYNSWICRLIEDTAEIDVSALQPALDFIRQWANSKQKHREAWAVAVWNAVHESRSELSTGSAVFHAFPDETLNLLQKYQGGMLHIVPVQNGSTLKDHIVFEFRGRSYYRILKERQLKQRKRNSDPSSLIILPIVGGYYSMPGEDKTKQLAAFREELKKLENPITVSTVTIDGCVQFYCNDFRLGQLPRDNEYYGHIPDGHSFQAQYVFKGRTLYLIVNGKEVENVHESISSLSC